MTNRNIFIGLGIGAIALLGLVGTTSAALEHESVDRFEVAARVHTVVVSGDAGDVTVVGGARGTVQVEQRARWAAFEPQLEHAVEDGVLRISTEQTAWGLFGAAVDSRIVVPRDVSVRVEAGAGDITLEGLAGTVEASADVGDVTGDSLSARSLSASTGAGDLDLQWQDAPAAVQVSTGAGGVAIDVPAGRYAVHAATAAGEDAIRGLVDDPTSAATIRAESGAGDITIAGR